MEKDTVSPHQIRIPTPHFHPSNKKKEKEKKKGQKSGEWETKTFREKVYQIPAQRASFKMIR